MRRSRPNYTLEKVWQAVSTDLQEEILTFWEALNALPPGADARQRALQAVYVARATDGRIAALCTAKRMFFKRMHNHLYYYRTLAAPDFRRQGIALEMLVNTRDLLENRFELGNEVCIGMLLEIENRGLIQHFRDPIWPRTGFIYIGDSAPGRQLRVYYFKGAKL